MNKYEFNSTIFECAFQVKFSKSGVLVGFEMIKDEGVELDKLVLILQKCLQEKPFLEYMKTKKIAVTRIVEDLSFDAFWKICIDDGSSKKKAMAIWSKMSNANKSGAILYYPILKSIKAKDGTAMPYSTTYLNGEVWNNKK